MEIELTLAFLNFFFSYMQMTLCFPKVLVFYRILIISITIQRQFIQVSNNCISTLFKNVGHFPFVKETHI